MSDPIKLTSTISLPSGFEFGEVLPAPRTSGISSPLPSLGPLAAFVGNWSGSGFNTIFRPDNSQTPTVLPVPVSGSDNILELNLTSESLSFSPSLGAVPNRGSNPQGDIFLNGVPYLQAINDVTTPGQNTGIHVEPGLWMIVPSTTNPAEGPTLVRMASIPHGTTIEAQGTATLINGAPTIPAVDITPFVTGTSQKIPFASQTAVTPGTPRIPQDLTAFINNGTITQAMLDDPNTFLRNHISQQRITATTQISISTQPGAPLFGGGTDNIAFLLGDNNTPLPNRPNAQTLQMTATFWIETVEQTILVPIFKPGQHPLMIKGEAKVPGQPVPIFSVRPPIEITLPRPITFTFTQIQYSQMVLAELQRPQLAPCFGGHARAVRTSHSSPLPLGLRQRGHAVEEAIRLTRVVWKTTEKPEDY
jgi:hypothetical protein